MENHWWTRARTRIVQCAIDRFPRLPILDIGCGPGLTVSYLRQRGYDCTGCEIGHPNVRDDVRDAVMTGTDALTLDPAVRDTIGLVLLLDVLEHIEDPAAFLRQVFASFPNLQGVIVTLPARQELWSAWDERYGHMRRYDLAAVRALFAASRLALSSARYFFHALYPVMRLTIRLQGRATSIAPPPARSPFHACLGWIFATEARIPIGRVPGTSIIAVGMPLRS